MTPRQQTARIFPFVSMIPWAPLIVIAVRIRASKHAVLDTTLFFKVHHALAPITPTRRKRSPSGASRKSRLKWLLRRGSAGVSPDIPTLVAQPPQLRLTMWSRLSKSQPRPMKAGLRGGVLASLGCVTADHGEELRKRFENDLAVGVGVAHKIGTECNAVLRRATMLPRHRFRDF